MNPCLLKYTLCDLFGRYIIESLICVYPIAAETLIKDYVVHARTPALPPRTHASARAHTRSKWYLGPLDSAVSCLYTLVLWCMWIYARATHRPINLLTHPWTHSKPDPRIHLPTHPLTHTPAQFTQYPNATFRMTQEISAKKAHTIWEEKQSYLALCHRTLLSQSCTCKGLTKMLLTVIHTATSNLNIHSGPILFLFVHTQGTPNDR